MREEFTKLLKEAYQLDSEDGFNFNFKEKGLTQKKIAEDLEYGDSQFGKMLKPNFTGKFNDVNARLRIIIRANKNDTIGLRKTKQTFLEEIANLKKQVSEPNKENQDKLLKYIQNILYAILVFSVGAVLLILYYNDRPFQEVVKIERDDRNIITDGTMLTELYHKNGKAIADSIATKAYRIIKPFHERGNIPLSDTDKETVMRRSQEIIKTVIKDSRTKLGRERNILIHHKESDMVELIGHIIPVEDFFKVPANIMILDTALPECASIYDQQLWEVRDLLFGEEPINDEKDFLDRIRRAVVSSQGELDQEERKQLINFQNHGEFLPVSETIIGKGRCK